jgi:hypothetical protein
MLKEFLYQKFYRLFLPALIIAGLGEREALSVGNGLIDNVRPLIYVLDINK